jgi:hypothetical protein
MYANSVLAFIAGAILLLGAIYVCLGYFEFGNFEDYVC